MPCRVGSRPAPASRSRPPSGTAETPDPRTTGTHRLQRGDGSPARCGPSGRGPAARSSNRQRCPAWCPRRCPPVSPRVPSRCPRPPRSARFVTAAMTQRSAALQSVTVCDRSRHSLCRRCDRMPTRARPQNQTTAPFEDSMPTASRTRPGPEATARPTRGGLLHAVRRLRLTGPGPPAMGHDARRRRSWCPSRDGRRCRIDLACPRCTAIATARPFTPSVTGRASGWGETYP